MKLHRTAELIAAATLATFTLLGTASLAHAAAPASTETVVVRFDDLNLTTQAGLQALYRRIQNAARSVCGSPEVLGSRIASEAFKVCVSESVRDAVLKIDRPSLTAYYVAQLRGSLSPTTG